MESKREVTVAAQGGKSAIGNLIVFALIAFGIWYGIQYIPQRIEAGTIRSILDAVEDRDNGTPIQDDRELWSVINNQLHVNDMNHMRDHFKVRWDGGTVTITVDYERELNLIFTTQTKKYHEQVVLR